MNEKQQKLINQCEEILNYLQNEILESGYISCIKTYLEKLIKIKDNREHIKRLK